MVRDPSFAPPVSALVVPTLAPPGVAVDPSGGQGLSLTDTGRVPDYHGVINPQIDYVTFTATVSITATTAATAQTVVSGTSLEYDGSPIIVEIFSPQVDPDTGAAGRDIRFELYDGSTDIGIIGLVTTPAASIMAVPILCRYPVTPTRGAHQYIWKAWVDAGTGSVRAGAGGAGNFLAGYIRVVRT